MWIISCAVLIKTNCILPWNYNKFGLFFEKFWLNKKYPSIAQISSKRDWKVISCVSNWMNCLLVKLLPKIFFFSINILDPWGVLWMNARVALWLSRRAQRLCSGNPILWLVSRSNLTLIISLKSKGFLWLFERIFFFHFLSDKHFGYGAFFLRENERKKSLLSTVLVMVLVVAWFCSEISTSGRFPSIQIQAKWNTCKLGACGLLWKTEPMRN